VASLKLMLAKFASLDFSYNAYCMLQTCKYWIDIKVVERLDLAVGGLSP
jgi:hypothetical protein